MAATRTTAQALLLSVAALAASGCSTLTPPRAWEKDLLARPAMRMEPDPLGQRMAQHVYASKENSSGGGAAQGGGCGCN